jgi:phage portal protein BeeE
MAGFLGDEAATELFFKTMASGGVTDMPNVRTPEVIEKENEEIYKAQASQARAMAFERRKRLPYLVQKGLSKPGRISYDVLRRAANAVHVVRICITVLREKITKTPWVIQSKDPQKKIDQEKIDKITEFFKYPNQSGDTFRTFLDKSIEDLLSLDAVAWEKSRYPDGTLAELHFIDAATIRPIYDEHGNNDILLPFARDGQDAEMLPVSYVQVVDDNPWGGREAGEPVAFWSKKDFVYFNMNPQGSLMGFGYGMSPIESVIGVVSNILSAENFNSSFFEEGSFPPMLLQFQAKMGQRELEQLREYMRTELEGRFYRPAILAGQEEIKVHNLKEINQKDMQFAQYMDFMSRLCAAAFGLKAQDVGLTDGENRATAVTQKQQMEQQGYGSILSLLKEVFNSQIIEKDFGFTDIEFDWVLTDEIPPDMASTIYDTALKNGSMTLNEVRKKQNLLPFEEWADKPAILVAEGYHPIVPNSQGGLAESHGTDEVGGDTVFADDKEKSGEFSDEHNSDDDAEVQEVSKSIVTKDGVYKCWADDRGVGQPFIFANILEGTGYVLKPPVAVNLDSQKLEEKITQMLSKQGLNVVPVKRMTEVAICNTLLPTNEVKKQFEMYQNMSPEYDSEKWRSKYGGSRDFTYYQVSKYVDGRGLIDPLLIQDMKRVPMEYKGAVEDLAKLWIAEKKYVLGDRRADQVIITPQKRAWGFDYQFVGNEGRWKGTKDAYGNALKQSPELYKLFMKLTGQDSVSKAKQYVKDLFGKASMQAPNPTVQAFEESPVLFGELFVNPKERKQVSSLFSNNSKEDVIDAGFSEFSFHYHFEIAVDTLRDYISKNPHAIAGIITEEDIRGVKYVTYIRENN